MKKIIRTDQPNIKVYTDKKHLLDEPQRTLLLTLIDGNSDTFGSFISRLKKAEEKYTKAEHETLLAIAYYADPKNFKDGKKITEKKPPSFTAYKNKELKQHLSDTFKKKCAYCDSKFLGVSTADIEHFRPKGAYNPFRDNKDEPLIAPGYYWLAADWNNLLWSCLLCNRRNNLDEANVVGERPLGKKNRFPIAQENLRVRSHNDNISEEDKIKLILDPCRDDPEEHFEYPTDENIIGIVRSKLNAQNVPSPEAIASIFIYGLNRKELVDDRTERALDLIGIFNGLLRTLQDLIEDLEAGNDITQVDKELTFLKKRFKAHYKESSPFLAMKKFLLEDFKKIPRVKELQLNVDDLIAE